MNPFLRACVLDCRGCFPRPWRPVERIADAVGTWRMEEEEEAVRAFAVLKGRDLGSCPGVVSRRCSSARHLSRRRTRRKRCEGCARHLIRDVTGQPLRIGIYVHAIYDIGRIENVHWNPWWSMSEPVVDFMYRNGEGFIFGRSDWEYVFNTFCFGYRSGYRFVRTPTGICNGNFLGIGADASWNAIRVDEAETYGLQITNGEFVSMPREGAFDFPDVEARQVVVGETNHGVVRFVNCSFWGPAFQIAQVNGTGTVSFSDCSFTESSVANPPLDVVSGNIQVTGCEFRSSGVPIRIGPNVTGGAIVGNIVHCQEAFLNESTHDIQIGLNSHTK